LCFLYWEQVRGFVQGTAIYALPPPKKDNKKPTQQTIYFSHS
jgi:hypothetical protein